MLSRWILMVLGEVFPSAAGFMISVPSTSHAALCCFMQDDKQLMDEVSTWKKNVDLSNQDVTCTASNRGVTIQIYIDILI